VDVWLLVGACEVVAAVALGAWYALFRPNLTDLVAAYVPAAPVALLVPGGLLFSMLNATVEEGAYPGRNSTWIGGNHRPRDGGPRPAGGGVWRRAHQRVPRGWVGVGLATIYGLMMGVVRRRSGGMLAPWIAHVLTDVVIAGIILTFERPSVAAPATAAAWWGLR
jgi:uncharacterized protein